MHAFIVRLNFCRKLRLRSFVVGKKLYRVRSDRHLFCDSKMREILHLQAGQCGNQIGAKVGLFDEPLLQIFVQFEHI